MILMSTAERRDIRNAALSALHYIAFEQKCEVSDILALLNEPRESAQTGPVCIPVEPSPAGGDAVASPATDSPVTAKQSLSLGNVNEPLVTVAPDANAGGEDADGASESGAPHSPERASPIPPHDAADDADDVDPNAPSSASDITENAAAPLQAGEGLDHTSPAPNQDRQSPRAPEADPVAGEGNPSSSPVPITKIEKVRRCHEEHPDWTGAQIGAYLGLSKGSVSGHLHHLGIKLARKDAGSRFKASEPSREARSPVPAPPQPSKPKTPPVIIPAPKGTLADRVRYIHERYPSLTASLIAKELGANPDTVAPILEKLRGESPAVEAPPAPEFTSRKAMLTHYGDVAQRLGKGR